MQAEMFSFTAQKAMRYLLPLFLPMRFEVGNKHIFYDGLTKSIVIWSTTRSPLLGPWRRYIDWPGLGRDSRINL